MLSGEAEGHREKGNGMDAEDLGRLPSEPVLLTEYDPAWVQIWRREEPKLRRALGRELRQLDHVGSTAVPGMRARPVVDILAGMRNLLPAGQYTEGLRAIGYHHVSEGGEEERHFFRRANPHAHLHIVPMGSWTWQKHLLFRDALRTDPALRHEYEALKGYLIAEHAGDRHTYNRDKARFVDRVVDRIAHR
jgi:GrpB-like predicted nucleotidyltransferase (UPF0157 family)